jgi:hypothetical protein
VNTLQVEEVIFRKTHKNIQKKNPIGDANPAKERKTRKKEWMNTEQQHDKSTSAPNINTQNNVREDSILVFSSSRSWQAGWQAGLAKLSLGWVQ